MNSLQALIFDIKAQVNLANLSVGLVLFRISPIFIFINAASTSHAIIGGTSSTSVCFVTAWTRSHNSEYNSSIRSMILYCSRIYLPVCQSAIIRVLPRLCVLLTLLKLLDSSIVYRISSKLCFRLSTLAFLFIYLLKHIYTG